MKVCVSSAPKIPCNGNPFNFKGLAVEGVAGENPVAFLGDGQLMRS